MKRGLNHKNSLPDPEFGGESSESARAIHYVVQKDTLMTYVSALIAQADLRKLRGSTIERKQMSTKTIYKRIALVAVASLGFGVLTSVSPASAAGLTDATASTFVIAGTTTAVTANAGAANDAGSAGADTIYVRSTSASNTFKFGIASATAADDPILYMASGTAEPTTDAGSIKITKGANVTNLTATDATLTSAAGADAAADAITLTIAAGQTAFSGFTFTTGALPAGTYTIYLSDTANLTSNSKNYKIATVTSYDVGAPATASYSAVGYTQIGSPANVNSTISLKDSSSRSTFLVGDETIVHSATPVTNNTAPAVVGLEDSTTTTAGSAPTNTSGVFAGYTVAILGAGTGTPTKNVLYTNTSTIRNGAVAFGSASVTYRNVDTTAAIAGGSITFTGATSKAVVSSISTVTSLQTTAADYVITVKDAAGALVKGATPVATASTGTVSAAVGTTVDAGTDSSFRFTAPATAGTSTVTFALSTGATSMSTSVAITATGYGATVATTASVTSVVKSDGSGVVRTSTLPATNTWSAARNVSGLVVTVGGLDASKVAKFTVGGNATGPKINATTGSIYPVASAAGVVTFNLSITSATNGQNITVGIDANGAGGDEVTLTISFDDTAAALTTAPVSGTLNMSTPSQTKPVAATLADQFGNAITGGSFTLTNTVVPAGATAATAVTANADAAGKATLNAVLGATLGTYTFELKAFSANAAQAGSTSTISWSVTTTGIAGTLTLTDNDTVTTTATTTDDKGSRTVVVPLSAAGVTVNVAVGAATTDSATAIIVTSATPAGLAFTATATNGIRLFTTTPNGAALAAGKSEVTGTAGSSINLWAVPTKVGAGTITVVSGGLTKVYTLTGTAAAAATVKSAIITLTPTANAGQYTVKASDALGNGVVNDVAISLAGPGAFSNGFKNLTVTTGADGTNTFNVVSDGSAATTITAKLSASGNGAYVAITAAEATASGLVLLGTLGASTDTATASLAGKGGNADSTTLATLTTLVNSLIAKINALNKLVIKIQKKVRA
jgi:trimeric autotransporter adhesin